MPENPYAKYLTAAPAPAPQADPVVKPAPVEKPKVYEPPSGYTGGPGGLTPIPGGPADPNAPQKPTKNDDGTVDEKKIATLVTRIAGGASDIQGVTPNDPGAQSPGVVESMRGGLEAGGLMGIPARAIAGANRRTVFDAQRDMLDAALTLGTGAVYNAEQLSGQMNSYFPQYGDTDAEIEVKNRRLERLILAAKANAGPAWEKVEPIIAPFMGNLAGKPAAPDSGNGTDISALQEQYGSEGLVGGVTDDSPAPTAPPPVSGNSPGYQQFAAGLGDIVEGGINNTIGLVGNPLGRTIMEATGYGGKEYNMGQIVRDGLGLPEGTGWIGEINQAAAGGFGIAGAANKLSGAINNVPVRNALLELGKTPFRDAAASTGAIVASKGAEAAGAPPIVQAGAALGGGMTSYKAAGAINNLASPRTANPVMQAANDLNVTMMPADVGGTGTRLASGVVRRTLGEVPMAEGARESLRTGANARDRVASNIGRVSDDTGAGQAAQRGARGFVAKSEARGGELYERISIPAKAQAQTTNTRAALAVITKTMESNPELSKLWTGHPRLKATLEALTPKEKTVTTGPAGYPAFAKTRGTGEFEGGTVSWEDFKRLRSIVGEIAGSPSLSSDGNAIKAMKQFYAALSKDMEATAAATSPRALTEFKRANQYWRGRETRIETVLTSILGNDLSKGEAAAFEQINRWAQQKGGDFKRLAQAMRSMGPDEANEVRASLLGRMGTASKGRQNADGNEFSPAEFVTQWNGLSARAKSMLFPDADHRKDITKLVTVMDGMKRAGEYANTSMTSLGTNAVATAGVAYANPFIGALYAGLQFGAGKLLASPRFARWVSNVPANPSAGAQRHLVQSLGAVAAKDPTIKAEIIQLSDYLSKAAAQSPVRAAAAEEEQDRRGIPPAQ